MRSWRITFQNKTFIVSIVHAGLFHPFDNGCSEPNDYVGDTAEEAGPQYNCPSPPPNSCPNKPAGQPTLDTIHSYMDYSPDACMNQFTPGQIKRMGAMWVSNLGPYHEINAVILYGSELFYLTAHSLSILTSSAVCA